jgi:hypothetical protein
VNREIGEAHRAALDAPPTRLWDDEQATRLELERLTVDEHDPCTCDSHEENLDLGIYIFLDAASHGPDDEVDAQVLAQMGPEGALTLGLIDEGVQINGLLGMNRLVCYCRRLGPRGILRTA